jgi:hypothetical protein
MSMAVMIWCFGCLGASFLILSLCLFLFVRQDNRQVNVLSVQPPWDGFVTDWTWNFVGQGGLHRRVPPKFASRFWLARCVWLLAFVHMLLIGEAAHPGPVAEPGEWTFGMCNPSGLNNKTDQIAHLEGHVCGASETQLSHLGLSKFNGGFKALKASWKHVVPGAPCPTRGATDTGNHSGVMLLPKYPATALPHSFDLEMYATARLQVAGVAMQGTWVTVGQAYCMGCLVMPVTNSPSTRPYA